MEHQPLFVTVLKFGHLEELFGICQIKISLLAQNIFRIFPYAVVFTKVHHVKLYEILWTNLVKLLLLLMTDLHQMLCKCHELLK